MTGFEIDSKHSLQWMCLILVEEIVSNQLNGVIAPGWERQLKAHETHALDQRYYP